VWFITLYTRSTVPEPIPPIERYGRHHKMKNPVPGKTRVRYTIEYGWIAWAETLLSDRALTTHYTTIDANTRLLVEIRGSEL
jgi:hypothetical protein